MNVETTSVADTACKDLIGEAYEAAFRTLPHGGMFSGIDALWDEIQATLKVDLSTTVAEDNQAMDIMAEVFEEACQAADEAGGPDRVTDHVDYQRLWERLCAVLGVRV